jgi:DNA helicase-2/ATP-dependent DNA helicase PcrA
MPFRPTDEQRAILSHQINRSARILAGPGTGKSATVVALLDEVLGGVDTPPRIKLLTFTRAATAELAHKVSDHPAAATLRPGTMHSFAISVLLRNPGAGGFPEPLRIADDWESDNIVKPTLRDISGFSLRHLKILVRHMASAWESLDPLDSPDFSVEQRARFLGFWEEHRRIFGYTLLAELPYRLREALQNHPDLNGLEIDALIVDEYQDLNACELDVLHRISERGCSVIAAGDDDQSIYAFREAAPEGIRRFRQDYPESEDYTLSVSLRCASNILNWANYVILGDTGRPTDRAVVRARDGALTGEVALLSFSDQLAEARGVACLVKGLIDQNAILPSEILVLMRSDYRQAFSNLFRHELEAQGISVSDPSAVTGAIAEPANREVIARIRLLCNRADSLAWATLFYLKKGIGTRFIDTIYAKARNDNTTFAEALTNAAIANFEIVTPILRQRALDFFNEIIQWLDRCIMPDSTPAGNWGKWIISIVDQDPNLEISDYFRQLLLDLDEVLDVENDLDRYVSQISPIGQDLAQTRSAGVRLMTMTSSKGLTVKATIVVGVEDGLIPHPLAHGSEDRRLLYVAMTRSMEFLYLTWARRRIGPTARLGRKNVIRFRNPCPFLSSGPVATQDGNRYFQDRFG